MATRYDDLEALLADRPPAPNFTPYCFHSPEANAITVKFSAEADYSERLTDHVTLFRSIETRELTGCRIKGIKELFEDLPNVIHVDHEDARLTVLLWSFRSAVADEDRRGWKRLAEAAKQMPDPCA